MNVALVTGASSGIGMAITYELARRGWKVVGVARSGEKLSQIKDKLQDAFIPITCDVSKKREITEASQKILDQGLCPSLFFLNAGIAGAQVIENPNAFDLQKHEEIMQVNYFGVLAWVEFWQKPCQEHGKTNFVVTSSINAIFAPPTGSAYSASKAAIAKAFEGLSLTYYGTNLHFSVAYPGPVDTPGLHGKLPFTWSSEKMGKSLVDFAISGKAKYEPSWFYAILSRILKALPAKCTMFLLRKM